MHRLAYVALITVLALSLAALADSRPAPIAALGATPGASPEACPTTTPEQNEALVRRFIEEVYNQQRLDQVDSLLTDDFGRHSATHPSGTPAPHNADVVAALQELLTAFPDLHRSIDTLVADRDQVAVAMTYTGTQMGPYQVGGVTVPATGRPLQVASVVIYRIQCGQIAEQWSVADNLTGLRQLGAISNQEIESIGEPEVATPAAGATPMP